MANIMLKNGQEVTEGSSLDDVFFANEDNLDAGDIVLGGSGFDTFRFFSDNIYLAPRTYGAFELHSVERIEVTNDSNVRQNFDLSGSPDLYQFAVNNSSQAVRFTQAAALLPNTSLDIINTTTVGSTDVELFFRNAALAGANDVLTVNVQDTDVSTIRIGRVSEIGSGTYTGIETVNLNTIGDATTINALATSLRTLNIAGASDITIANALVNSVRTINAVGATGDLTISFADNDAGDQGVVFTGSAGANTVTAGDADDVVTTFGAGDSVDLGGGDNVANLGQGNNFVVAGGGLDRITTGNGADTILAGNGNNTIVAGRGSNLIVTGNGADTITGGANVDTVFSGDGNDVVRVSAGADYIDAGDGLDDIDGGSGNDIIAFGSFLDAGHDAFGNPLDRVKGGTGQDELRIDAMTGGSADDLRFENVSGMERLTLTSGGSTYLGGNNSLGTNYAERAGIREIRLDQFGTNNDAVNASSFARALSVQAYSGTDTILTGAGNDTIEMRGFGAFTDADTINGGAGRNDTIRVEATTTLTAASQFSQVERLQLTSGYVSPMATAAQYNITLDDENAPSSGPLTIAGGQLRVGEHLTLDGQAVSAFALSVNGGLDNDVIRTGQRSDTVNGGAGDDQITSSGLADDGDTINAGVGDDTVTLLSGINTVVAGTGFDRITLGTGTDTVDGGDDDDVIVSGTTAGDQLTGADVVDGGTGSDQLQVDGSGLTDVNFAGVRNVEDLVVGGVGVLAIGANAQSGGIRNVVLQNAGASTLNASAYSAALSVDASAGGDDVITTGTGDDRVMMGAGTQSVTLLNGNDTVFVDGSELDVTDTVQGGLGTDTIVLDNVDDVFGWGTSVTANVNLDLVRSVENYRVLGNGGQPFFGPNAVALTFTGNAGALGVGSLTNINVDFSALTDGNDAARLMLANTLADADYQFTVFGSSTATTVEKANLGVNNNLRFLGGTGSDTLVINGNDLGSTVSYTGGGGTDTLLQSGGLITDDGFTNVGLNAPATYSGGVMVVPEAIEVLSATAAAAVNAQLGFEANASGLDRVVFSNNANALVLDENFTAALSVQMGSGADLIDASASAAALTIDAQAANLTAGDTIRGGTSAGDVLNVHVTGDDQVADLSNLFGTETINLTDDFTGIGGFYPSTRVVLATQAGDVATQTINTVPNTDAAYFIDAGAATANLNVNLAKVALPDIDVVLTGSGADRVDLGYHGANGSDNDTYGFAIDPNADHAATGAGNDTVLGEGGYIDTGSGDDTVTLSFVAGSIGEDSFVNLGFGNDVATLTAGSDRVQGDDGNDRIDAGASNDVVDGGAGTDTLLGGDGDDALFGGAGADTLTGGAGSDLFVFDQVSDSVMATGRDTITDFASGVDRIDLRSLDVSGATLGAGDLVQWIGNRANFTDAQGSLVANSNTLQVVYQSDLGILWADSNDDGVLDGHDIQITVTPSGAGFGLTGADVFAGSALTDAGAGAFISTHGLNTPFFTGDGTAIL